MKTPYRTGKWAILIAALIALILILPGLISAQDRILSWGSRGQDVKNVQWKLLQWGYYKGPVDGIFQTQTSLAVREFQRKNGLAVDGVVGEQTLKAMGLWTGRAAGGAAAPSAAAKPPSTYTATKGVSQSSDVYLIARLIHGEAQAEPYLGKVAVGAVLLNRVESPSFPNTLAGVIFQPRAFESVSNGRVYVTPTDEEIRAARDALSGWDPTYGSLYFWNPYKPVSGWIWTRKIIRQIGKHVFGI